MKTRLTPAVKATGELLAGTLANFAVISFGLGVYERNTLGYVAGIYALFFALFLRWRIAL